MVLITLVDYYTINTRYAACIAELLSRANRKPADLNRLGTCVLAPAETIGYGWFKSPLKIAGTGIRR